MDRPEAGPTTSAAAGPPDYADYRPLSLDTAAARLALYPGIAERLGRFDLVTNILPVTTNIVIFDLHEAGPDAETAAARLLEAGVRVSIFGPRRLRVVTHLDVGAADAEALLAAFAKLD